MNTKHDIKMNISYIIPTRNEREDIELCMRAVIAVLDEDDEILVVDDSDDETPKIIIENFEKHARLIRGERRGLNAAYNIGIKEARNDIVVLLTADNILNAQFRTNLLTHYEEGYGAVICRSRAININDLAGRYFRFLEDYKYDELKEYNPIWSEGFSCLREVAFKAGLLKDHVYIVGGTDNLFAKSVAAVTVVKYDKKIFVDHLAPRKFSIFTTQIFNRGVAAVQLMKLGGIKNFSFESIIRLLKATIYIANGVLVFPSAYQVFKMRGSHSITLLFKLTLVHAYCNICIGLGMYSALIRYGSK